jgi:hypothetical protein
MPIIHTCPCGDCFLQTAQMGYDPLAMIPLLVLSADKVTVAWVMRDTKVPKKLENELLCCPIRRTHEQ